MAWLNYRFSDEETIELNIVYDYGTYGLWSLLFWTNHLYHVFYWVSLGWFYLLDIHRDYSLISPFCGVAQMPDCGMLVVHLPFKKPFMWCRPDARLRYYYSCSFLSRSHSDPRLAPSILLWSIFLTTCVHLGLSYILWQTCDHIIIRSMFDIYILHPCY